jgi:L-arabinose isomerase
VTEGGFGAFTDTFEDLGGLEQLPGIGVQRMMADGYGFGAEGDWKAAALVRILKTMAQGLPGGTSFMEDYTYHLGDPVPEVLGAHMLEVCPSLTTDRPSCEIHPLSIGGRSDPVRLVFDAAPGPAVILGLADLGDRFRLIASEVDVVEADAPLPKLPVARAVWRPRPSLATAAEAWLMAGGPHHTTLTTALGIEAIEDFAEIADLELVTIDASTTASAFKHELRWNQAYYYLNRGP